MIESLSVYLVIDLPVIKLFSIEVFELTFEKKLKILEYSKNVELS